MAPTHSETAFRGLRALVLGFGSIGQRHTRNLRAAGVEKIWVFDPDPVRIDEAREAHGITGFTDLEAAWATRPDLAFVTSPTAFHVPHAREGAERGCHLFVEKPLSHSTIGIADLLAVVEARSLVTMVGCNMRFHPGPSTVKRLLRDGAVGEVRVARVSTGSYLPAWRAGQDYRQSYSASLESGGVILDCIHEIDLALWYLGPARLAFSAVRAASSLGLETDGIAELILEHESGAMSSVHLSFVQRDYRRGCAMVGDQGTAYWDFAERAVSVFGADGQMKERLVEPPDWQLNQMYADEMVHFLTAVVRGRETVNPIREAAVTTGIALEARRPFLERNQ